MDPPIQNGFWSLPYFLCSTQEVKLKFEQTKGNILLLINSALSPPLSPQHWSQMSPNSQKYLHASLYCCVDLVKQCFNSLLRQRMEFLFTIFTISEIWVTLNSPYHFVSLAHDLHPRAWALKVKLTGFPSSTHSVSFLIHLIGFRCTFFSGAMNLR